MTKEELLQKGISEELADEIIAGFEEPAEDSLQALSKAVGNDPVTVPLAKAEGGDEKKGEEEEDYNEEYMKKHTKRYMKENKKACSKMAKDVGLYNEDMNKAIDSINLDTEGAVVEMTDLEPFLSAQKEFNGLMAKAVESISGQIGAITIQSEQSFDLMQKAARVQVEQAVGIDAFLSTPNGKKGVTADVDLSKAVTPEGAISKEGTQEIYQVLMKATKAGDEKAGQIISAFESGGQNARLLNKDQRAYVSELLKKEAK